MLNHVVLMKFKPETTDAEIEELEAALDDLPNKIIEIHSYEFGRDVIRSERSYDFALIALVANEEALGRYQNHPDHQKVVQRIRKMCESIFAVDFYGVDASSLKKVEKEDPLAAPFDD